MKLVSVGGVIVLRARESRVQGKDARGLTFSRSNSCFVPDEVRVNRLPGRGRGAAVNANEMTSPVVTLGAEVANPWRARCPKRGTPGSEEGVVETTHMGTAPCPYPAHVGAAGIRYLTEVPI
jgi:hypothetical protein